MMKFAIVKNSKRIEWRGKTRDLFFTLRSLFKDKYPYGFEAFGIADLQGPHGFVSLMCNYYSNPFTYRRFSIRIELESSTSIMIV